MKRMSNPKGGYYFLSGIAPYSSGVAAMPGNEIMHVIMRNPPPYREGFEFIDRHLAALGRPRQALCAIQLRIPRSFSFEEFSEFNQGYLDILDDWDLPIDGVNPIARTNVAPAVRPPGEAVLYAFSYTVPQKNNNLPPTFIIAGAGELKEGELTPDYIVRPGETGSDAVREKVKFVMGIMQSRLSGLQVKWTEVTTVNIYTVHPLHHLLAEEILTPMQEAGQHAVRWYYSSPPISGLEYEMDMRGVRRESYL
ncbi:MAG: hypothetical protein PVF37_06205 [Desulfobacterales bacterium]|jgi:hypothetical protein